jgi:hypothetical protein
MEKEIRKITEWLESPAESRDFDTGALLYLKNNPRKRILYDNIVRRKLTDKLKYELVKTLDILQAKFEAEKRGIDYKKLTDDEITAFTERVELVSTATLPAILVIEESDNKGKRADHDTLPAEIKKKYDENGIIYPKMRALFEKLKLMDNEPACDRYPFLKQLVEFDETVIANWDAYDSYDVANPPAPAKVIVVDTKRVNANRKYLSDNKEKLAALKADAAQIDKFKELFAKMQQRIDELTSVGEGMKEDQANELRSLGLLVGIVEVPLPEKPVESGE